MGMFSPVVVFYVWLDLCSASRKPKCAVRISVIACFVTLINKFLSRIKSWSEGSQHQVVTLYLIEVRYF